jgi:pyruvate dehydrogenase (quinone)/pyruvate oxidase
MPRLNPHGDRAFLERAQAGTAEWRELMVERGTRQDRPMKPQVVAHELGELLAPDAIIAADSGTNTGFAARYLTMRGDMRFACSGTLASMGCALPYAIAAALAYPQRQVVAFVGDGGLTMMLGELATAVKYGLDVKVVVLRNNSLGQIKWEQIVFLGNPEYACDLQPVDFAAVARGFGIAGFTVEDPARCGEVLRQALATPGPALVDAVVDTHEPPMPPKVSLEQAKQFALALARGTPHRGKIALTVAADRVRELI